MKQLLTLLVIGLAAGAVEARDWSYDECLTWAREHNVSLKRSKLKEQTAAINLDEAKGSWLPSLDFATSQGVSNNPWGNGVKTSYTSSYGVNLGWTVWNGGQRENSIKRSEIDGQIAATSTETLDRNLSTDILQSYLNILYARESIIICQDALKLSTAQAERAKRLMDAGRVSRVDYAQLLSQQEQDRYALVNAQGTYESRIVELKSLMQLSPTDSISLVDYTWTEGEILAALPDMVQTIDMAYAADPTLNGLALEQKGAELDLASAKAGRMPNISLNGSVGTGYSSPGNWADGMKRAFGEQVGVTLSIPILDQRKTKSAEARAVVAQLDNEYAVDNRLSELNDAIENWFITTRSSQSRYVAAQEQLKSAQASVDLTDQQFQLGLCNPVELMKAHSDLTDAQFSLLQAKYMAMMGQKMIHYYRTTQVQMP